MGRSPDLNTRGRRSSKLNWCSVNEERSLYAGPNQACHMTPCNIFLNASLLVLALRLRTRRSPSWLTSYVYINAELIIQLMILTPGRPLVLASRLTDEIATYRESITNATVVLLPSYDVRSRTMDFFSPRFVAPSSVPSLRIADGSIVTFLFGRSLFPLLLEYFGVRRSA